MNTNRQFIEMISRLNRKIADKDAALAEAIRFLSQGRPSSDETDLIEKLQAAKDA